MSPKKSFMAACMPAIGFVCIGATTFAILQPSSNLRPPPVRTPLNNGEDMPHGESSPHRTSSLGASGALVLVASAAALARRTSVPKLARSAHPIGASSGGLAVQEATVCMKAFENELGVQAPAGFWDPLGFTADGNVASFKRRRSVELKHSRICMLAAIGYMQPELTGKWPGFLSPSAGLKFADIPNGLGAISKVPALGWAQIVALFGFTEFSGGFEDYKSGTPGDYGWKVLTSADMTERTKKLAAEIANGRLAMMSIIGMFFQDGLTGSAWGDWALYTGSPLRAFENELGVQAPAGFWDPLGFTADGNVASFKRRRSVELKHSRICMLAAIGYMQPELTGKWPGFLSPSAGLKFADIPNGLGAISKVPALGWAQIVANFGFTEFSGGFEDYKSGTPGDYGWKVLTSADMTERTKKLAAEIANGRLAMMSIIGMFFQDGLTGSAWGDWALYTGSPLRAFENELGVQAPAGFWDPLGFTADGNVASFKRRRSVELKHSRICMLAAIGYMQPELTGKWPGFLSPSAGLKFADIPNGLGAISKVPALGWAQIVANFGFTEFSGGFEDYKSGTPGDYGWKVLTSADMTERTKKLAAEIANGRLAMMSIIGMFFQDGLTGSAWGDWALYTGSPLRAFESEFGVQAPLGYWDPLGLGYEGNSEDFRRRRATEIKHGRVSMLACIGYMAPEYFRWPGSINKFGALIKFDEIGNGIAALGKVPPAGIYQILCFVGWLERGPWYWDDTRMPGDIEGAGMLGVPEYPKMANGPERTRKLNAELANGRLAMASIIGMFFQDGLTGKAWGDWASYTASPLRAFEGELGVQAPLGYWDPMGFAADGNVDDFKRRRITEIKHSRVCMIATLGYMFPEFFRWPGYCSPSLKVQFEQVPNGIGAFSKLPFYGWFQIVLFCGLMEKGFMVEDPARPPGDLEACGTLGVPLGRSLPDGEEKFRRLSAELANGRLAMFSIMGMLFQDGLTGGAWGDWALYQGSPLR